MSCPLSCRLTRLYLNSVNFGFGWRSVSCFRPLTLLRPTCSFVLDHGQTMELEVVRAECPDFARLIHCFANFWWRVLLSCRLTRLDLNSVQLRIALKDGVLWRLHCRISSFWTSPGRFPRIVAMSKSGVGDVWMRTTPGVALRGEKPRRKYFSSLHLTRWTDHLEPKKYFILALNRITTSPAVLFNKSQRLCGIIWTDYCPFSHRFWTVQPREQPSTSSHIQDKTRFPRLSRTGNVHKACFGCFPKTEPESGRKWTARSIIER